MTYLTKSGASAAQQAPRPFTPSDIAELLRQVNGASGQLRVLLESLQHMVLFAPRAEDLKASYGECSANAASFGPLPTTSNGNESPRHLTARELDVLRLIAKGYQAPEVASMLGLSPHTVRGYVRDVYRKLGITSRAEATMEALRRGLVC